MSHAWKFVFVWCAQCLMIFSKFVTSLSTCLKAGECPSGFYCHTGGGLCVSCDKCSESRGNLWLCKNECEPEVLIEDPATNNKPMIAAIVVPALIILVAVIVAGICLRRRRAQKLLHTGIPETGVIEPSQIGLPATSLLPDFASPDESPLLDAVNH